MSQEVQRVVLAYSGGLDTSVILKWLLNEYGCEVVTADHGGKALDIRKRWRWADDLDLDDLQDLQQAYADADCGYDTEIEVQCMHCSNVQAIDLPLGRTFLVPDRSRRKRPTEDDQESTDDLEPTTS